MKYRWCITTDWETPAKNEVWHKARTRKTAFAALRKRWAKLKLYNAYYCRRITHKGGGVYDLGSYGTFGRIEEIKDESQKN